MTEGRAHRRWLKIWCVRNAPMARNRTPRTASSTSPMLPPRPPTSSTSTTNKTTQLRTMRRAMRPVFQLPDLQSPELPAEAPLRGQRRLHESPRSGMPKARRPRVAAPGAGTQRLTDRRPAGVDARHGCNGWSVRTAGTTRRVPDNLPSECRPRSAPGSRSPPRTSEPPQLNRSASGRSGSHSRLPAPSRRLRSSIIAIARAPKVE